MRLELLNSVNFPLKIFKSPDENVDFQDSDNGDPYGISEPDHWHAGEEAYSDESFHRRLQKCVKLDYCAEITA